MACGQTKVVQLQDPKIQRGRAQVAYCLRDFLVCFGPTNINAHGSLQFACAEARESVISMLLAYNRRYALVLHQLVPSVV